MHTSFWPGRPLVQWGLLAYLLEIPFARGLEPWLRDIPLLVVSIGLILGLLNDRRTERSGPPFELKWPALVFLTSFAIAIAVSEHPEGSLDRAMYLPIGVLAFFAAQYAFIDVSAFRRLSLVLLGVVLLIGIDGSFQLATGESLLGHWPSYAVTNRTRASLPHPNDLSILALLLPIALVPLRIDTSRWVLGILGAALSLVVLTVITSQSRNTWIGLVCGLLVLVVLSRMRKPLLTGAFVGVVLAFVAWSFDLGHFRDRLASLSQLGQEGRIGIWLTSLEMWKEHPWFGIGPNLFADFYLDTLSRTPLPDGYRPELTFIPWAHNLYLEALAERGAVGLLGFLVIVSAALRRVGLSLGRRSRGAERDYAVALAASWAAFLVMGLFDLTFYKDWVWLIFWVLVALSARLSTLRVGDAERGQPAPSGKPTSLPAG